MMRYMGYTAKVEYDDMENLLRGRLIGIRDIITFDCRSVDELQSKFESTVDDYLLVCQEEGKQPDRPFSGHLILRVDAELHRGIAVQAGLANKSINAWIAGALQDAVKAKESSRPDWEHVFKAKAIATAG